MTRKTARLLIFYFVIFWLNCSKDSNPVQPSAPTTNEQEIAQHTHDLVNAYRLSQELPALVFNSDVANVALEHSRNMAAGRLPFSHDGFDQRMSNLAKKIKFNTAAENVAVNQGYQDPAAIAVEG